VGNAVEVREIDRIVVAGQTHPEVVFELLGRNGEIAPERLALRDLYQEGLAAYRERRWDDALRSLSAALEIVPGDGPSSSLLARIGSLKANPPPQDWDGSWHIEK
jgi:adenylate cyclase